LKPIGVEVLVAIIKSVYVMVDAPVLALTKFEMGTAAVH